MVQLDATPPAITVSANPTEDVFRKARHDGLNTVTCLRMVRQVFHLSLSEGKAVMIKADTGVTLQEHEETLLPGLKQALQETEEEFQV